MNEYRHHVSGFFAHRDDAESARNTLLERGLSNVQIQIFSTETPSSTPAQQAKSDGVLEDVLVDGAIGTAVGTGIGALGSVALAVGNVSLFVANPLLAPLMLLGWGASVGGLIGATAGASAGNGNKKGWLSDLVRDAIANGQVVLVVETRTPQETDTARGLIQASVGVGKDTNMV
ncbi:hypothetical protein [Thiocapsa sp.]|uniref:hypothetical protein n=1 Tax=Thiocapsa sp. TaxID=2024551 RepID=UPI003593086A